MTNISRAKVLKVLLNKLTPVHQMAYRLNGPNRSYKREFPFETTLEQKLNQETELLLLKWKVQEESQSDNSSTKKFSSLLNHTKQVSHLIEEPAILKTVWETLGQELKLIKSIKFFAFQYYEENVIPVMDKLLEEVEKETHNGMNSKAYGEVVGIFKILFYTFHPNRKLRRRTTQD